MKLSQLNRPLLEIWRSPVRVLHRVNAGSVRACQSDNYSKGNVIHPFNYFKHEKKKTK